MSPGKIDPKVVSAKTEAIRRMLDGITDLPLGSFDEWTDDPRMIAAGESYLRRALEALLDLARHLLAKGFGRAVPEYAAIADALEEEGILAAEQATTLRLMARYRNRMVHFYDDISTEELYDILTEHLGDISTILEALQSWLSTNAERLRRDL